MAYNKSEIMKKAYRLRTIYSMSKSEALSKAWSLAKLSSLEARKFYLSCKDRWDSNDYAANDRLDKAILAIKKSVFPEITRVCTRDRLKPNDRAKYEASLARLKAIENPTANNICCVCSIEERLSKSIETWTVNEFDEGAYSAA